MTRSLPVFRASGARRWAGVGLKTWLRVRLGAGLGVALLALGQPQVHAQPSEFSRLLFEAALPQDTAPASPPSSSTDAADAATGPADAGQPGSEPSSDESGDESGQIADAGATQGGAAADSDADADLNAAATQRDIARYQQAISALELERGPYAPELGEQLRTLAGLLEASGDHAAAATAYEKAMHIVRVNEGLFTLTQADLVEDIIRNYMALGEFPEADNRQEYLYYLKQKNFGPDDPELLEAKIAWADWNVQAYYRRLDGHRVPVRVTGFANPSNPDYIPVIGPNNTITYLPRSPGFRGGVSLSNSLTQNNMGGTMTYMLDPRLRAARDLYEEIGETAAQGESTESPRLQTLSEQRLANISFIVKQEVDSLQTIMDAGRTFGFRSFRPEQVPEVARGFVKGRDVLVASLEALREDPESTPEQVARVLLDLADWHLVYERQKQAADYYQEAWDTLRDGGFSAEALEAFFAPRSAVEVPAYATHRYSRALLGIPEDEVVPYKGYVDVQMELTRYGSARRLKVLASSEGTPREVQNALLDHLRIATLRPRLEEGQAVSQDEKVVRYYYSY